ncbi:MAG: hypothetical protein J5I65_10785 [Aridibacter famidurans]|nr:hypothetical protein [Aridibacter famidurans]
MSFTLIDLGSENFEFRASVWNWKTLLEIVKSFDVIGDGKIRQMSYNAAGTKVSVEEAHEIGGKIRDEILPGMSPGMRIFSDLSVTEKPDDGTLYRDDDEKWKNYSVDYEWLKEFSEFCFNSKGFQVY